MMNNTEMIKTKLFGIETMLAEKVPEEKIRAELDEVYQMLDYVYEDEREWIENELRGIESELEQMDESQEQRRSEYRGNEEEEVFDGHNEKLDTYLSMTLDNLSNLKEQRRYIKKAKIGLGRGKESIISGMNYIKNLRTRHEADFKIFTVGICCLIGLVFILWWFVL